MAYVESEGSDIRYLDDKRAFAARDSGWRRLTATALNPTDSVRFMEDIARSFHAHPTLSESVMEAAHATHGRRTNVAAG